MLRRVREMEWIRLICKLTIVSVVCGVFDVCMG